MPGSFDDDDPIEGAEFLIGGLLRAVIVLGALAVAWLLVRAVLGAI